jgi:hypothetical protein
MKTSNNKTGHRIWILLFMAILMVASAVIAEPTGTTIVSNSTNPGRTNTPANRSDAGGTITTLDLSASQQDQQWKAYVGNISGSLSLQDSNSFTIYEWALSSTSITGRIFASRSNAVTWSTVNCTSLANITAEETALNINSSVTDSIKNTFNLTVHPAIAVAGKTISANTCNATSTYVSSARQAQATADFPEVILSDTANFIYATIINNDKTGYIGAGTTYDFQLIVADNPSVTSNMYYFYAELGS